MSMLSAIILAILLLASCSKNASESSFHDAREALDAQKEFLSKMKSDKDLSMVEKPLNFDPFGHARFAHLFVLYD